ncbi:MAG: sigma-70 family RNA polymerase sigma factor [Fimbriimonadaceae bacterium]|nr:sigma-70 family RNA polymerase sigma factor [Fimbriimonadaceae bacterium]
MRTSTETTLDISKELRANPTFRLRVGKAVERYRDLVYRLAYAIVLDREAAQDLTQEVLLKVVREYQVVSRLPEPEAWVRAVTLRASLNVRCRKRHHQALEDTVASVDDDSEGVAVRRVMAGLDPEQRAVIALCLFEGLSYREAALVLGIPEGTVASRLSAARAEFRDRWGEPDA